jgi:hypothetical protein
MSSGSELVSSIAITGIPSFLASLTAVHSLLVSMINKISYARNKTN